MGVIDNISLCCDPPFLTIYFAWKEKEKGLEPAEVSKQLTTLNLINAVFYI